MMFKIIKINIILKKFIFYIFYKKNENNFVKKII